MQKITRGPYFLTWKWKINWVYIDSNPKGKHGPNMQVHLSIG